MIIKEELIERNFLQFKFYLLFFFFKFLKKIREKIMKSK